MNWKEFIIELLKIASYDVGFGFIIYLIWKYVDLKYFSKFDISILKEENKYLKEENRKIKGNSSDFWEEENV